MLGVKMKRMRDEKWNGRNVERKHCVIEGLKRPYETVQYITQED